MRTSFLPLFALPISVFSLPLPQTTNGNVTETTGISSNVGASADGSSIINSILAAIGNLPGIGTAITDISGALTTLEAGLATLLGIQDNENGACAALTVIFARGTTEPGNVGVLTGPEFLTALQSMLGSSVTMQGVAYSASIEGFLEGGDPQGSQVMAQMVSNVISTCPNTKVVMSGYSQGGQLVHNAAKLLPAATMAKVNSVVIFGDPDNGEAVQGATAQNTLVICHTGDDICLHGDLILIPHLTYSENAQQAATFVAAQAGLAIGNP